jgi:peptidoglycan/LPS O-acetylase OafA/YrhL
MRRLECLDGLRGALAVYVMLSHMAPFADVPRWIADLFSHGGAGVDMFFILSGLVITGSLETVRWRAAPFLIMRTARIFPAYIVVLAVAILVQPIPTTFDIMSWVGRDSPAYSIWSEGWPRHWGAHIAAHLMMIHGLFPDGIIPGCWVSFLGAAWSLSTEWQFYILVLLAGRLMGIARAREEDAAAKRRQLATLFMAAGIAGGVWQQAASSDWVFSRAFLPNKAQYFALGIASANLIYEKAWGRYANIFIVTMALSAWEGGVEKLLPPIAWTICLISQLCPGFTATRLLRQLLLSRATQWCGGVSYSLYLANEPVQKLLGVGLARVASGNATLFTLSWLPLAALLPLMSAAGLRRCVELPCLRLGRSLSKRRVENPSRA